MVATESQYGRPGHGVRTTLSLTSVGDEVYYVTDDETGAGSTAVASWQASRDESADSWEHQLGMRL